MESWKESRRKGEELKGFNSPEDRSIGKENEKLQIFTRKYLCASAE